MTETMRERMARAMTWAQERGLSPDDPRTVDAILDVLAEPSEAVADRGDEIRWARPARVVDSSRAREIWAAMITAIREGK